MKLEHRRAFPAIFARKAAPILGFALAALAGCASGPPAPRFELATEIWVAGKAVQQSMLTVRDGEAFKLSQEDAQVSRRFECKVELFDATTYTLDCDVQLFAKNGDAARYRRVTPKVYSQLGNAAAFHAADAQDPGGTEWAGLRVVAKRLAVH